MSEKISTALRQLQADSLAGSFSGGTLRLYTGSQPSSANDSPTGTLLTTIDLPEPAFVAANSSGEALKTGEWAGVSVNTGTAGWFRFANGSLAFDGSVTGEGGGGEIELDTTAVVIDETVTIANFKFVQPAS